MRKLSAADYKRTPWKNGAGETMQVAVFPEDAGLDDFIWRISMATIAENSVFSTFAGIDRSLLVVDGDGAILTIAGEKHLLRKADAPLRFSGDVPTTATLIDGQMVDFNVMTRRGVASHTLYPLLEGETLLAEHGFDAVLALGDARVTALDRDISLAQMDMLILSPGEAACVAWGPCIAITIRLQ